MQRERAQAPAAGALKHGQLQDVLVQVHGDVGAQLIGEVMQQLQEAMEKVSQPDLQYDNKSTTFWRFTAGVKMYFFELKYEYLPVAVLINNQIPQPFNNK